MKKLFIIAITSLFILGCNTETNREDYIINGTAKGIYNGIRVYLKGKNERGRTIEIDTAIIFDEKFTLTGKTESPELRYLYINNVKGSLPFMLENNEISIEIDKETILNSKIVGSKSHEDFTDYKKGIEELNNKRRALFTTHRRITQTKDSIKKDSIENVIKVFNEKFTAYPLNYINENTDKFLSLNLIETEAKKKSFDVVRYKQAFDNLSSKLNTSSKGIAIGKTLERLYKTYQKNAHLEVGKIAPNFEAPTPDGKTLSLNAVKGKVTIIDFWAAWCGPCRKENPNVVKLYNKFHTKGLEIIGVSLDGSRGQNEPKKAWLDAIEKDQLTWHQVSNLKHFADPVAQLYNIRGIPATYVLDAEGKIAAKNLRGKALELKVKELLGE